MVFYMTAILERHISKDHRLKKSKEEKALGSRSEFMPHVGMKRLPGSIRKGSTVSIPAWEREMEYQTHLRNYGPALLHYAGLAVAHAGCGFRCRHNKRRDR